MVFDQADPTMRLAINDRNVLPIATVIGAATRAATLDAIWDVCSHGNHRRGSNRFLAFAMTNAIRGNHRRGSNRFLAFAMTNTMANAVMAARRAGVRAVRRAAMRAAMKAATDASWRLCRSLRYPSTEMWTAPWTSTWHVPCQSVG